MPAKILDPLQKHVHAVLTQGYKGYVEGPDEDHHEVNIYYWIDICWDIGIHANINLVFPDLKDVDDVLLCHCATPNDMSCIGKMYSLQFVRSYPPVTG